MVLLVNKIDLLHLVALERTIKSKASCIIFANYTECGACMQITAHVYYNICKMMQISSLLEAKKKTRQMWTAPNRIRNVGHGSSSLSGEKLILKERNIDNSM